MDFARRYRVISTRDVRFDGQFFTAVRSTGIYCRPSCPARTPKEANVTFYPTAAAAHEAGYRACKRCLPNATPGTPEWNLRDDLAARAMRLIADGVLERGGVPGLARSLGYSERHLTRVLVDELGAGPLALARAHRAQTARTLLTTTTLPMSDVAFASGFASVRQFNDTVREVFALTPTQLRAASKTTAGTTPGTVSLTLPAREPFEPSAVFRWLAERAIAGVEVADGDSYARTLLLPHGVARLRVVGTGGPSIRLTASMADMRDLPTLVARVRRLFDLDADPVGIDAALSADPIIAERVLASPGLRLPGSADAHEMLVRAVVGQQISVAAARTHLSRMAARYGRDVGGDPGEPHLLFPTASDLAGARDVLLTGPRAKADTLRTLVAGLADGSLELGVGDDRREQHERLTAYRGIGPWTAGYVSMRVLGNPDVLLDGDVALRAGAQRIGFADDRSALVIRAASLAPWRSYLCLHLWAASGEPRPTDSARPAPSTRPAPPTRTTRRPPSARLAQRGPSAPLAPPSDSPRSTR